VLARIVGGEIIAVDNHAPFLAELNRAAEATGLDHQIFTYCNDMQSLDFPENSFDLIWSEAAIYIIGFERGLRDWAAVLKQGGWMGVSEVCWLTESPPPDAKMFWQREYPGMRSLEANRDIAEASGYRIIDTFVLPQSDWWDGYYTPLIERVSELETRYADDAEALAVIAETRQEIEIFRSDRGSFGYVFFVLEKKY
jgi:ubiquinone/menaquinone biosynthesis C-methylase UbiE